MNMFNLSIYYWITWNKKKYIFKREIYTYLHLLPCNLQPWVGNGVPHNSPPSHTAFNSNFQCFDFEIGFEVVY